jgi:hypothetical protein
MSIDFDDMTGGFADQERDDPKNPAPLGLVVAPVAAPGELAREEAAFRASTAGLPMVVFVEEDDDGGEVFANAATYRDAMGIMHLPSVEEAMAWQRQAIADRLAAWKAQMK